MSKKIKLRDEARRLLASLVEAELNDPEGFQRRREAVQAKMATLDTDAAKETLLKRYVLDVSEYSSKAHGDGEVNVAVSDVVALIKQDAAKGIDSFQSLRRRSKQAGSGGDS